MLADNPVIPHLIDLLAQGVYIGIVTAAGYPDKHGEEYIRRLSGLLSAVATSNLSVVQKENLAILGGECNYLFRYDGATDKLIWVDEGVWRLDEMQAWKSSEIQLLLDIAERVLCECAEHMRLKVQIIRKPRAVGIPLSRSLRCCGADIGLVPEKSRLTRECLEEAVLASQRTLSHHPDLNIPFCCFNGGSDVWVDVGDKSLGVSVLQRYFHNTAMTITTTTTDNEIPDDKIWGGNTLHVGDQFMSLGGNDFKAVVPVRGLIVEEILYDGVGCESGGNGRVAGGVEGVYEGGGTGKIVVGTVADGGVCKFVGIRFVLLRCGALRA